MDENRIVYATENGTVEVERVFLGDNTGQKMIPEGLKNRDEEKHPHS